jgi:inorganic pyrophosphatase
MNATQGLAALPARDADSGLVNVVIDTPRGSRNKFKYDEELSLFRLSKVLPLGSCFPFDFGFIPSTRAGDGDPVDVLVLMDEPTFPGCLLTVRLLGVLRAEQTQDGETFRNDRLVGVPVTKVNRPEIRSLDELGKGRLDEIEHFFMSYNQAEGRQFKPLGRHGPDEADRLVADGERQYAEGAGAGGNGR